MAVQLTVSVAEDSTHKLPFIVVQELIACASDRTSRLRRRLSTLLAIALTLERGPQRPPLQLWHENIVDKVRRDITVPLRERPLSPREPKDIDSILRWWVFLSDDTLQMRSDCLELDREVQGFESHLVNVGR